MDRDVTTGDGSPPHRGAQVNEQIHFGRYPQSADGTVSHIAWRVLQNTGDELFLLSECLLDCKRYHRDFVDVTWQDCDLRRWLNTDFFEAAFSIEEQCRIGLTRCENNGDGSPDTRDRVFLLSIDEIKTLTNRHDKKPAGVERRATGTAFARQAKADGCRLYVYDKSMAEDYLIDNGETTGCSWWWLRTRAGGPACATFVGMRATIRTYGHVDLRYYGVRPAIKVSVS